VASRKGFPHVVYAKIWRWPDLHKNELKHLEFCQYGFDVKDKDLVCVNPYHYTRVIGPGLDLSGLSLAAHHAAAAHGAAGAWGAFAAAAAAGDPATAAAAARVAAVQQAAAWSNGQASHHPSYPAYLAHNNGNGNGKSAASGIASGIASDGGNTATVNGSTPSNGSAWYSKASGSGGNTTLSYTANGKNDAPALAQARVPGNGSSWSGSDGSNGGANGRTHQQQHMEMLKPKIEYHQQQQQQQRQLSASVPNQMAVVPRGGHHSSSALSGPISTQPMPENWCSIAYFELDSQVGETFKVLSSSRTVDIDGYVEPVTGPMTPGRPARFCLGALTNVHRTEASEKTRLYIGKGIRLELDGEGDVWIRCLSQHAIFVQSYYLDREAGRAPGDAVHKIHPEAYTKVFDLHQCYHTMRLHCAQSSAATAAQAAAVAGGGLIGPAAAAAVAAGGVGVDEMRKLCILRMSFVKGWGQVSLNLLIRISVSLQLPSLLS